MDAGHQKSDPDEQARHGHRRARSRSPIRWKRKDAENTNAGDDEAADLKSIGVEDGDDQYRDDVVDDGERQQEHAHIDGDSIAPSSARTPTAKAMSVAVGTAQPRPRTGSPLKPR